MTTVVLVEGVSDRAAVEALALRDGRDLVAESVTVVDMGGATNVLRFVREYRALGVRLAGLCDAQEAPFFERALGLDRAELSQNGFFVCDLDLEDELIRALGVPAMERLLERLGDSQRWRTFSEQPFQRSRPVEARLRRFIGTTAGRKERYAPELVAALEPDRVPAPLRDLLEFTK
jgi:hypothetical protein